MNLERCILDIRRHLQKLQTDEFCSVCTRSRFLFDPEMVDPMKKGIRATNGKTVHIEESTTVRKLLDVTGWEFERVRSLVIEAACDAAYTNRDQFARFCRELGVSMEESAMPNDSKGLITSIVALILTVIGLTAGAVYKFSSLENEVDKFRGAIVRGVPTDAPIGSIIPYYLEGTPPDGWLICDGRPFDGAKYPKLRELLGKVVPDLRGLFLRGAGQNADSEYQYADDDKRRPGSPQLDSTKLPDSGFGTDLKGEHYHRTIIYSHNTTVFGQSDITVHPVSFSAPGHADHTKDGAHTSVDGNHAHAVTGGDQETRPKNYAVQFIMKAR